MIFVFLGNWEDILVEISSSNIVQRDNIVFARKLNKNLAKLAKEKDKEVRILTTFQRFSFFSNLPGQR